MGAPRVLPASITLARHVALVGCLKVLFQVAASVKNPPVVRLLGNEYLGEQEVCNTTTQFAVDISGLT